MIKESIHQDITTETDNTIIVAGFNTLLSKNRWGGEYKEGNSGLELHFRPNESNRKHSI